MELVLLSGAFTAVFSSVMVGIVAQKTGNAVRASSGSTLVFIMLLYFADYLLQRNTLPSSFEFFGACFYAGSFVGMNAQSRMNKLGLVIAGLILGALLLLITPRFKGMGGALGASAFIASCLTIYAPKACRFLLRARKKTRSS